MTKLDRKDYFARRAEDERRLANAAIDKMIARIHSNLASRYDALIAAKDAEGRPTRFTLGDSTNASAGGGQGA